MRYIYTVLFYCSLPFILLRLLWRARNNPAYAACWAERFGFLPKSIAPGGIWIHAVSVGESLAAVPIIKALQKSHPHIPVLVTTTTPTGADRVRAAFGDQVALSYIPYDLPVALNRFLDTCQPRLLILMETELWPNLLHICGSRKIPVFLANGRLSTHSAQRYQRIASITREMLQNITLLAVQTQTEAERFIALGLNPTRVEITGSIKFDLELPNDLSDRAALLRAQWGENRPIWIAASTHEGEEDAILNAFAKVRTELPQTLLVLVPRHPDRFARVAGLCKRQGYNLVLRSENQACSPNTAIFIGDTMGELLLFYAASDLAFVGGSLIPTGGHNPLEPAAIGLPVIMGPHLFNFLAISEQLQTANAMIKIQTADQLAQKVLHLLKNKPLHQQMSENARKFVAQNRGALAKHLSLLERFLQ